MRFGAKDGWAEVRSRGPEAQARRQRSHLGQVRNSHELVFLAICRTSW